MLDALNHPHGGSKFKAWAGHQSATALTAPSSGASTGASADGNASDTINVNHCSFVRGMQCSLEDLQSTAVFRQQFKEICACERLQKEKEKLRMGQTPEQSNILSTSSELKSTTPGLEGRGRRRHSQPRTKRFRMVIILAHP